MRPFSATGIQVAALAADLGRMFRSRILPAILALWGAAIVLNTVIGGVDGSGSYAAGQLVAVAFGLILAIFGIRALMKAPSA